MATHRTPLRSVTRSVFLLAAFFSFSPAVQTGKSQSSSYNTLSAQQLDNLVAFTKLYGYVRFFHPSDESAGLNWEKFAVYGSDRVLASKSRGELVAELYQLFGPIAPTMLLYGTKNVPGAKFGRYTPEDTTGLKLVAWQHLGVGLSPQSVYRSFRLNRPDNPVVANSQGFGTVTGSLDPARLRGKRITLRAAVRAERGSKGHLWLRVDRPGGRIGFFDNMEDRPILLTEWNFYEITGTVDSDAERIVFGCMLSGSGKVWLDDVHIFSGEGQQREEAKLTDPDFELDAVGAIPQGWQGNSPGYSVEVTTETALAGKKSVAVRSTFAKQPSELFPERPTMGEVITCDLPRGISARVSLVLYADSIGTLPREDRKQLDDLNSRMDASLPKDATGREQRVRLGGIVIAWNVFQHFYPYFDLAGGNWENELRPALEEAGADTSGSEYLKTLQRLVVKLGDGHGGAWLKSERFTSFLPPFQWTWAEGKLVITALYDTTASLPAVGDIVLEVDGRSARKALEAEEIFIPGATPQWKRFRALANLLDGPENSTQEIRVEDNTGRKRTFSLPRTLSMKRYFDLEREHQHPTVKIADGIYYVNLSVSSMPELDSLMSDLVAARGIICDLRGYPNGNHALISHLLSVPDTSTRWMAIPKVIYPDQKRPQGYDYRSWKLQPEKPHIPGKVVFLTDGRAISYAESYLSFIEYYKLADIVGEPTAGTNGNVNPLNLPGGYQVTWTGMRVTKHDGSQHHGVGIQPTLTVHPTIKGIREGKDEQLDAALKLIN